MSPALKNRLVGTIIVVAIAVIFLPDLLDGKKETKRALFVDLPIKPRMKVVEAPSDFDTSSIQSTASRKIEIVSEQAVDDPKEPEATTDAVQVVDVEIPDEHAEELLIDDKKIEDKPVSTLAQQTVVEQNQDKLAMNSGWVVQLGSFRHQKNVSDLLAKLEESGYRAFSRPVKTSSGNLTKVFVGPDLDKKKLTNAISHLKELTQLQGKVTPFTVR
ncbi:SPOR domain-containing protein [Paraglaciecola aquimarina]|uniref:SPOR domain-containing protein n=1 Tax=Paraglaciecola aquimarina TaxID=1235557 RepID=A0ABU3SXR8_9ALTE|nr:SPOR domain-containing protein [Paraglaciecola aquimarina]MDU0354799.1 SPOR domain-containing protein [Paraglaciecola aquimarina]